MKGTEVYDLPKPIRRYKDGRPSAQYRLDAIDYGRVLRHGDGPNQCDLLLTREAIVFESEGTYYLHYDGCRSTSSNGSVCLAVSNDLINWTKKGPVLSVGVEGKLDAAGVGSPWTYFDGKEWHMFYIGVTRMGTSPGFECLGWPYLTMKAKSQFPVGPWTKQYEVIPFSPKTGTYYSDTASAGHVLKAGNKYLMFFSASTTRQAGILLRTLGIARTRDLDGPWTVDPQPIVPLVEQVENSSLYYEEANGTWFLFTNHIGIDDRGEYTDAVWVYWSKDVNRWDTRHKAVVLDGDNCTWSSDCIGMPSVIKAKDRLALFYDAPGEKSVSHFNRDIGLAWLDLPLIPPIE